MIGGGDTRGVTDAEGFIRPLPIGNQGKPGEQAKPPAKHKRDSDESFPRSSSDPALAEKIKPDSSKSSTLNGQDFSMRSRNGQAQATTHSVPDPEWAPSLDVASSETRDRRAPSSSPSDDGIPRSDSISQARFSRAKVIRSRKPREAVVIRAPSVKQDVGVMRRVRIPSAPQKARSASPPVLLHRSSATAVLIPPSRSASGVTSAITSSSYSELPAVVDVSGKRLERMNNEVASLRASLRHSVSDGDLLEQVK